MDPLSDLLRVVRLDGAYFYAVEAAAPWSVETAPARELTPRIMPAAEHLISYHIVTDGHCYGGLAGEDPVELARGDAIVFPQGDAHVMSSERDKRPGADVHRVFSTDAAEGAHQKDLATQDKHDAKYLKYWVNEQSGDVFCLVEAPTKEAAIRVHQEAHGLLADEIVEVVEGL